MSSIIVKKILSMELYFEWVGALGDYSDLLNYPK